LIIFGSLNPFEIKTFLTYLTLSSSVDEVHMLGALCQNALFEKAIIILPLPTYESIPYLIVSIIIHQAYQWYLLSAYELGDLTKVYPIARGTGPLVATIISILFLGLVLDNFIILSILIICLGIIFLSLFDKSKKNSKIIQYSLLTGLWIGLYSVIDGYGARVSLSAISFISWVFVINALLHTFVMRLNVAFYIDEFFLLEHQINLLDQPEFQFLNG